MRLATAVSAAATATFVGLPPRHFPKVSTSSSPMPYLNNARGLRSTRTAGSEEPLICTWPMPDTWPSTPV